MDDGTAADLASRLRAETKRLDEDLDTAVGLTAILASRLAYSGHLARLWRAHSALDAALCTLDFSSFGFDYSQARRAPLLEADLLSMGYPPGSLPDHLVPQQPRYATLAHALGAVYIIERASRDARTVLPQITSRLGYDGRKGASFFVGLGSGSTAMWRACLAAINSVAPASAGADRIIDGAAATLAFLRTHVPAQPHRTPREDVAS